MAFAFETTRRWLASAFHLACRRAPPWVKVVTVTLRLTARRSPSSMRFFSATTRSPALVERNHWATSDGVFP